MVWQKGQSGNPKGRPKKGVVYDLEKAIKKVEKAKGKKLLQHAVEQAFEDNSVLTAVLKKLLPDLRSIEASVKGELELIPMSPAEKLAYMQAADQIKNSIVGELKEPGGEENE